MFKYIYKAQKALEERKANKEKSSIDSAIEQIEMKEEEQQEDDLEVIAVITAAIAAMEQTSTDGFVVRSIRRVPNRKWK